jgi:hypothetical protein
MMSDSSAMSSLEEEVFREVGRAILAFQQLERMLKFVTRRWRIAGTPEQIVALAQSLQAKPDRRTLGRLVDEFEKNHLQAAEVEPLETPWLSFQLYVDLKPDAAEDYAKKLAAVVKKRNDLVHHSLEWLRLDSESGCKASLARLHELNKETRAVHDDVKRMLDFVRLDPEQLKSMVSEALAKSMLRRDETS